MYPSLSSEERVIIKRIVNYFDKGLIGRKFQLVERMSKSGKLFLYDPAKDFKRSDLTGWKGSIDNLVRFGLLNSVGTNEYYLPQAALDAVANNFRQRSYWDQTYASNLTNSNVNLADFAKWLHSKFNLEELENLCFGLTRFEDVPGDTISRKSRALVEMMERQGRIMELIERVKTERPNQIQELEEAIHPKSHN